MPKDTWKRNQYVKMWQYFTSAQTPVWNHRGRSKSHDHNSCVIVKLTVMEGLHYMASFLCQDIFFVFVVFFFLSFFLSFFQSFFLSFSFFLFFFFFFFSLRGGDGSPVEIKSGKRVLVSPKYRKALHLVNIHFPLNCLPYRIIPN